MPKLNAKQKRFVDEYLIDMNATNAAKRAGYSLRSAPTTGSRMLKHADVSAYLETKLALRTKRLEISQDNVLKRLSQIAFGDARAVMTWDGEGIKLRPSEELSEDSAAMVAEVSETTNSTGGSMRVKLHDPLKALELIGRNLGMFTDRHELTGKNGGSIVVESRPVEDDL